MRILTIRGPGWLAVRCGIDQDEPLVIEEIAEQVEPSGSAINELGLGPESRRLEVLQCEDADPFIAHEHVAHAQDEGFSACWLPKVLS